jgi:type VI protein secretion system component Hcp
MAVDMILELEDIEGESKVENFEKKIDVSSFSWGASNSGSAHIGGGASGGGKGNIHDMSFTKTVDNASPTLFKLCYLGSHRDWKAACPQVGRRAEARISIVRNDRDLYHQRQHGRRGWQ